LHERLRAQIIAYDKSKVFGFDTTAAAFLTAIRYATELNVDVINLSAGGPDYSREEALAIQKALNKGIKIIAAAGNENTDFSQKCQYYPACYDDRIISVGCMNYNYEPCTRSNFGGKIKMVQIGEQQNGLTGTSQATAIATGLYVKMLDEKRKGSK
jgi:cell wall-associated protease